MGYLTRTHHLGQTVAPAPAAVARALADAVADPGAGFDAASAAGFAREHTIEAFTDALLGPLLGA